MSPEAYVDKGSPKSEADADPAEMVAASLNAAQFWDTRIDGSPLVVKSSALLETSTSSQD